jgi:DNA-binding transcriptional MocR family regulator
METRIQGKFYPLQHDEWIKACKELSSGARDVLYYIRTADPYSNGINITASVIADDLGVHRSTVSRALKELDFKGFINLEIVTARVEIQGGGLLCAEMQPCCKNATSSAETQQPEQKCNSQSENATSSAETQQAEPESQAQSKSQTSKINKNYLDFIKTLSEGERESFWKFGQKKAAQLPKPPELPMKWIEANWSELYQQFKSTAGGMAASVADKDWTQHPDWNDWLGMMRERGVPTFVALGTCFDNKIRRAIADWALKRNLVWGTEA